MNALWRRALLLWFCWQCAATVVPRYNLAQLTESSEWIVHGAILRSWTERKPGHQFTWIHHELKPVEILKGRTQPRFVISEPGGELGGVRQVFSGTPRFRPLEEVIVFLYRTPIGYIRVFGLSQGKYTVRGQRLAVDLQGITFAGPATARSENWNGAAVNDFKVHIRRLAVKGK
ncbi:MAG: hypothetical protein JNN08_32530 [Bryobacterales bacterium]|nr:hypothetical protein [Bryobacterales bacterium]